MNLKKKDVQVIEIPFIRSENYNSILLEDSTLLILLLFSKVIGILFLAKRVHKKLAEFSDGKIAMTSFP